MYEIWENGSTIQVNGLQNWKTLEEAEQALLNYTNEELAYNLHGNTYEIVSVNIIQRYQLVVHCKLEKYSA